MKILLTGATGFVGRALTAELLRCHYDVVAGVRKVSTDLPNEIRQEAVGDFSPDTEWSVALQGIDVVVHSAARVHVINENHADSLPIYRRVNVDVTLNLARQAAAAGVRRFIFISSIKVNGEKSAPGQAFKPDDLAANTDPYALSKYEAEQELMALSETTGMEIVIIRPPLIYGPGVRANFRALMKWVNKGVPLPFGAIHNKRSLLALDNLLDFVICCINHPKAANQIF
nr:NAD-dependent epimerase/dehydratase family protein [Methylomarinum sp. Ch1-1]MDP4522857.1 NAD-dependent epimerase/dehydratase family protein [Methylomarinum sp. Ch1-1]